MTSADFLILSKNVSLHPKKEQVFYYCIIKLW